MALSTQTCQDAPPSTPNNESDAEVPLTGSSSRKPSIFERSDKDAIHISAAALEPCFAEDPIMNWALRRPDGSTLNNDTLFRQRFFNVMMALSYGGGASFITVGGEGHCVGVLIPPGKKLGGLRGYLVCWRDLLWCLWKAGWRTSLYLLLEHDRRYVQQFHDAAFPQRREVMEKGDYYYIYFLGTDISARGQGLGSAFLSYAQQIATKAGKPIYLESSAEKNKNLYLRHGFEVVKELVMGEGEVGRDGKVVNRDGEGKNGVVWWAMTWWPKNLEHALTSM